MKRRNALNRTRICPTMICLLLLGLTLGCPPPNFDNLEYFEDYPHLTNEAIGSANYFISLGRTHPDYFPTNEWGNDSLVIPGEMGGASGNLRYQLGFGAQGLAMAAEHTPAYRKPYVEAIDGLIQKMLRPIVWDYWLEEPWGGDNPIHPYNIMYTGHLQLMMAYYERHAGDGKYFSDFDLELGDQTWTTNLLDLSADIHQLILNNQDSLGRNYYSIPCETPNVYVVCNSVPQLAFDVLHPDLGFDAGAVHDPWLAWVEENLVDAPTMHIKFRFWPFTEPPVVDSGLRGIYSAWSWLYIYAMDPAWVEAAYPVFKATAFEYGTEGPGTAVVRFGPPGVVDDLFLWDMAATGYAMALAKQLGDQEGYEALMRGHDTFAGPQGWFDDGTMYGYYLWPITRTIPNIYLLQALTISPDINYRTVALSPRDADFYNQPILADVTNPGTFVNQAIWDDPVLYITVNGGVATDAPTHLIIKNLKPDRTYHVLLGDEVYTHWTLAAGEMTITTPPLSGTETHRFQIVEEPAP